MSQTIRIEGLKQLTASLKGFERDIATAPQKINKEAAALVAADAKGKAPHRSGRLSGSIKPGASGTSAYVRTALIYSAVQHFGWPRHHIKPKPFLFDALDARREAVITLYEKRIGELAEKVHGI